MEAVSAALVADLKALTDVLDEPGVDFEELLRTLAADTQRAVDSYLGLAMTLVIDGYPVTLTAIHPADIATSMRVPLDVLGDADPGSVLVLYAAKPGAFVDLAADLSFALGLSPGIVILDDDLTPTNVSPGLIGLAELAQVNQAIGILIKRGHLPDDARAELHRLADHGHTTVAAAAQEADLDRPTRPHATRKCRLVIFSARLFADTFGSVEYPASPDLSPVSLREHQLDTGRGPVIP